MTTTHTPFPCPPPIFPSIRPGEDQPITTSIKTKIEHKIHLELILKDDDLDSDEQFSDEEQETWRRDLEREAESRCRLMSDVADVETWQSQEEVSYDSVSK